MTFSAPLANRLWPLVVFGVALDLVTAIAAASWPVHEHSG